MHIKTKEIKAHIIFIKISKKDLIYYKNK